jgi:hypothetical protein
MRDLKPYCPIGYYYDVKEEGCDEIALRQFGLESYGFVPGLQSVFQVASGVFRDCRGFHTAHIAKCS